MPIRLSLRYKGGAGSGNKGHAGIKGHLGGSQPKGSGSGTSTEDNPAPPKGSEGGGTSTNITINNVSTYQRNMLRTLKRKSSSQTEFMQWISGPVFRTLMSAGLAKRRKKYSFTGSLIDSQGKYDDYGAMLTRAGRKFVDEVESIFGQDFENVLHD